jgi:ADP-heptose:LPS heptosyltransferase
MANKMLKSLEIAFRHYIVYPILQVLLANKSHSETIDLSQMNKLLIFRQDRIGDMIITTPIFRKLKKDFPHLQINVLASQANASIVKNDPNIDRLIIKETRWLKRIGQMFWLRKQNFDVLLNFIFNKTTTIGIYARLICPNGIKIGQGSENYKFYFNHFLTLERGKKHTCELYIELVEKVFGIQFSKQEYRYELYIPEQIKSDVRSFLNSKFFPDTRNKPEQNNYILLNISAAEKEKSLSPDQSQQIAHYISNSRKVPLIVISAPWDVNIRDKIITLTDSPYCYSFPESGNADLLAIADIIRMATFVVTPDTSIVHFASTAQTPVIGVYTPLKYTEEWYPYEVEHSLIIANENKPVSDIKVDIIYKEIDNYLGKYFTGYFETNNDQ